MHRADEGLTVDVELVEHRGGVEHLVVGAVERTSVEGFGAGAAVQGPLHGQHDGRPQRIDGGRHRHGAVFAQRHGVGFDRAEQVEHPPVLQPDLVVEEASELFGELTDGPLRAFAGVDPVVVHAGQSLVQVGQVLQSVEAVQQVGQLVLTFGGEEQLVEGTEAAALIGLGDAAAGGDDVVEQLALGTGPTGDLLAQVTVEGPEVLLDLAEVRQQLAGGAGELLVAVALDDRVCGGDPAGLDASDLLVESVTSAPQVCQADRRVVVGLHHQLAQQLDQHGETGFGADEGAVAQAVDPGRRLLRRRGQVEVRFVGTRWVEAAEPAVLGIGPLLEVVLGRSGVALLTELLVDREEVVVETGHQLGRGDVAGAAVDVGGGEEAQDQGRVVGAQQRPGRVLAEVIDLVVVHDGSGSERSTDRVGACDDRRGGPTRARGPVTRHGYGRSHGKAEPRPSGRQGPSTAVRQA